MVQPTVRGRQTQAAIDEAARTVIARKGILSTTVADIAAEAGRSTASSPGSHPNGVIALPCPDKKKGPALRPAPIRFDQWPKSL